MPDLVAEDCVMEAMQPAPNGERVEGYDANVRVWLAMVSDPVGAFEVEEVAVFGDRAINPSSPMPASSSRPAHDDIWLESAVYKRVLIGIR